MKEHETHIGGVGITTHVAIDAPNIVVNGQMVFQRPSIEDVFRPKAKESIGTQLRETGGVFPSPINDIELYFNEACKVPLLTHAEEISLAKRIEAGKRAKSTLLNNSGNHNDKVKLLNRIQDGREASQHFTQANTRLVIKIAKKYFNRWVPFLDLIQAGNRALIEAVDEYDYKRGFRFSTYATWPIREAITTALVEEGRTIRIPINANAQLRKMNKAIKIFTQENGREPTNEELAKLLHKTPEWISGLKIVTKRAISLNTPDYSDEDGDGRVIGDRIKDTTITPSESFDKSSLSEELFRAFDNLTPREAKLLRLRYGFVDGSNYTFEELGKKFGLSRQRMGQIEEAALKKLRHPRHTRKLRDYL